MKSYKYGIVLTLICFASLRSEVDTMPKMPGAEAFTKTIESLKNKKDESKTWYQLIPSIGVVDVPHEKMQSHRFKIPKLGVESSRKGYPNFQIISQAKQEWFKEGHSSYIWGYAKNLNNRPFVAVEFKVQGINTGQWLKNKDGGEIFSIIFTYMYITEGYEYKGQSYKGYRGWITTGGDGAHYLGQYDVRNKDVTEQDMKDIATLIAKGSVNRGPYKLMLADIKDIK